jgi:hypothetical protein
VDRADIVQYVGLPPREAIYWILRSCLVELVRAKIISPIVRIFSAPIGVLFIVKPQDILGVEAAGACFRDLTGQVIKVEDPEKERSRRVSVRLFALSEKCTVRWWTLIYDKS